MKIIKTTLLVTGGIAGGLVIANCITGGAVKDAIVDMIDNVRGASGTVADIVEDAADDVSDTLHDVMAEASESM